ncbi:MAG TPA: HAMP domain-containing sensor histidine kinase [Ignavibacteriales bacterium]|nr:HAMP domain-containing sensor histidine kinase [Ignavibacteriales bacterium]
MYCNGSMPGNEKNNKLLKEALPERRLEELIANITTYIPHELRTPLVSIMGFTQIITDEMDSLSKEDLIFMVRNIEKSSRRLHRTIEKFINFADLECLSKNIKMRRELEDRNLHAHTKTIKETVMNMAVREGRNEDLLASLDDSELQIPEDYLKLITKELFDNALKFSKKGSKLEVTGEKCPNSYQMEIKDYGTGITEEEIKQIEPFRQFDRKTLSQEGNGLGLPIVRRITQIFGCGFTIISRKGSFTAITIDFPYKKILNQYTTVL